MFSRTPKQKKKMYVLLFKKPQTKVKKNTHTHITPRALKVPVGKALAACKQLAVGLNSPTMELQVRIEVAMKRMTAPIKPNMPKRSKAQTWWFKGKAGGKKPGLIRFDGLKQTMLFPKKRTSSH